MTQSFESQQDPKRNTLQRREPTQSVGGLPARDMSALLLHLQRTAGNRAVNALLQRSSPLRLQRAPSANPDLTVTPILEPDSPGPKSPNPNLTVTPILGPDPAAPVKAQPPRVASVSKLRLSADGKQIVDTERMRVGEHLIVRVALDHVKPGDIPGWFVADKLTVESADDVAQGVVQIRFLATKIGAEHAEMHFMSAGAPSSEAVSIPLETHVEMGQEAFRGQLQEATQYADNAYHAANLYMTKVGPPYREAWENVKKTLEKAGEGNPFNELVLNLVLTFLSGLAGGKVAEVMEHLKKGLPLTEGLKELTMHAVKEGLHAVLPKASTVLPQDPADWADASHQQIEAEALAVGAILEDMIKANNDNRAGFFRDFDVVEVVHAALTINGQPMRGLETAPIPTADDFEKTIWQAWLRAYGTSGHGPDINDEDAWSVIGHRITDLGEDFFDYLRIYMGGAGAEKVKGGSDE